MINFDEEVKKFHPCMEIEQLNREDFKNDLTDMTDVLREMYLDLEAERTEMGRRR